MCGISAIVNKNKSVNKNDIKAITDLIAHRGPNSSDYYYGSNFQFGHRRLSILDLSDDGKQPMEDGNGNVIIFNGEIYNYLEIKDELLKKNYIFKTTTDTEVILAAYDNWGVDCLNKFNGMWSFCIYNKIKNVLFCARDRFGIKPFYYSINADRFVVGSEIKQLLYFIEDRYIEEEVLVNFFANHTEYDSKTFFKDIFQLPGSHYLTYDLNSHRYEIIRYYELKAESRVYNLEENIVVSEYYDLLKSSIALRLRSDVKVGTCLSGGLDSSSVASLASQQYTYDNLNFSAIHAKSTEKYSDESNYAELVKEYCGLNLSTITPSTEDFRKNIERVIYQQEEPFGGLSILMQDQVFKKAKELNCTVMLDGQGGDETLLGYERYYFSYISSLPPLKRLRAILEIPKKSRLSLKTAIYYYCYFNNYRLRLLYNKRKLSFLKDSLRVKLRKDILKKIAKIFPNTIELQKFDLFHVQLPNLLKYEDRNSMAHSIESRLPFLDYRLVEFAISINPELKMKSNWSKYILRKAIEKDLPPEITWRREKRGFESPTNTWLEEKTLLLQEIENSEFINMIVKKLPKSIDNELLWKLYNVSVWARLFNVKHLTQ